MSEKESKSTITDVVYASHNEQEKPSHAPEPELVDTTGRRQSVALNIVENPLKVSFASQPAASVLTLTLFTLTAHLQRADHHQCPSLCRVAWYG
jgi:hypothetical protein